MRVCVCAGFSLSIPLQLLKFVRDLALPRAGAHYNPVRVRCGARAPTYPGVGLLRGGIFLVDMDRQAAAEDRAARWTAELEDVVSVEQDALARHGVHVWCAHIRVAERDVVPPCRVVG